MALSYDRKTLVKVTTFSLTNIHFRYAKRGVLIYVRVRVARETSETSKFIGMNAVNNEPRPNFSIVGQCAHDIGLLTVILLLASVLGQPRRASERDDKQKNG